MAIDEAAGFKLATEMFGPEFAQALKDTATSKRFGELRGEFAMRWVFSELWLRPGLDRRARSLVLLGVLIAKEQPEALKVHVMGAIGNGCSVEEIEEAIYNTIPYVGFPASAIAADAAAQVLKEHGLLDQNHRRVEPGSDAPS